MKHTQALYAKELKEMEQKKYASDQALQHLQKKYGKRSLLF